METTLYTNNGNYFNESEIEQHKEIYELLSYTIYGNETVYLMDNFEYFRKQNSYRITLKWGQVMLNAQVIDKIAKSNWEINYLLAEEYVNWKEQEVKVHLVLGLRPKGGIE